MKIIVSVILLLGPLSAYCEGLCGPTVQTFWRVNIKAKTIKQIAKYNHKEEKFCPPSDGPSFNAKVNLFSEKGKIEISQPIFISRAIITESFENKKIMRTDKRKISDTVEIQIKFINGGEFKSSKSIQLIFNDGTNIGPSEFQ